MENVKSSQPRISIHFCTEIKFFPVSIIKEDINQCGQKETQSRKSGL